MLTEIRLNFVKFNRIFCLTSHRRHLGYLSFAPPGQRNITENIGYKPFAPLVQLSLSTSQLILFIKIVKIPQRGKRFVENNVPPLIRTPEGFNLLKLAEAGEKIIKQST